MILLQYVFSLKFVVTLAVMLGGVSPLAADDHELFRLGLPDGPGSEDVEAYCGACHSLRTVVQQGLDREGWDELLVWMVEEQEMEPIDAEDRKLVLDYLAKYVSIEARRDQLKTGKIPGLSRIPVNSGN